MKKIICMILVMLLLQGCMLPFTRRIAPPHLALVKAPASEVTSERELVVYYDKMILVALPFFLWMDAGLVVYDMFLNKYIVRPYKAVECTRIAAKLLAGETVSQKDIESLTLSVSAQEAIKKDFEPFDGVYQGGAGFVSETLAVKKIDIIHDNGCNIFMLLDENNLPVTYIEGLYVPPLVYVEYRGEIFQYCFTAKDNPMKVSRKYVRRYDNSAIKKKSGERPLHSIVVNRNFDKISKTYYSIIAGQTDELL